MDLLFPCIICFADSEYVQEFVRCRAEVFPVELVESYTRDPPNYMNMMSLCASCGIFERNCDSIEFFFSEEASRRFPRLVLDGIEFLFEKKLVNSSTIEFVAKGLFGALISNDLYMDGKYAIRNKIKALNAIDLFRDFKDEIAAIGEEFFQRLRDVSYVERLNDMLGDSRRPAQKFWRVFADLSTLTPLSRKIDHLIYLYSGKTDYEPIEGDITIRKLLEKFDVNTMDIKSYCLSDLNSHPWYVGLLGCLNLSKKELDPIDTTVRNEGVIRYFSEFIFNRALRNSDDAFNRLDSFVKQHYGFLTLRQDIRVINVLYDTLDKLSRSESLCNDHRVSKFYCRITRRVGANRRLPDVWKRQTNSALSIIKHCEQIDAEFGRYVLGDCCMSCCAAGIIRKSEFDNDLVTLALRTFIRELGNADDFDVSSIDDFISSIPKGKDYQRTIFRIFIASKPKRNRSELVVDFLDKTLKHLLT